MRMYEHRDDLQFVILGHPPLSKGLHVSARALLREGLEDLGHLLVIIAHRDVPLDPGKLGIKSKSLFRWEGFHFQAENLPRYALNFIGPRGFPFLFQRGENLFVMGGTRLGVFNQGR